jgi:hypothetical protein
MSASGGPPQDPWSWDEPDAESAEHPQSRPPAFQPPSSSDAAAEPRQAARWPAAGGPQQPNYPAQYPPPAETGQQQPVGYGQPGAGSPEASQQGEPTQYLEPLAGYRESEPYGVPAAPYEPAQPSGYPAQTGIPGWPTGPPTAAPAKKRRTPLIIGLVALLVVALLAGGYFAFLAKKKPKLTFNGKPLQNADQILDTGQKQVLSQVSTRHGVKSNDTRCYFAVPNTPAAGAKKTDVAAQLLCGPVLFVDGTPGQAYLIYTLNQTSSQNGKVVLAVASAPQSPNPSAPPQSLKLQRPDGDTPPSNGGNLRAPAPPPAEKDALVVSNVDDSKLAKPSGTGEMVGDTYGVQLLETGVVDRYGSGDSARVAPGGTQLVAFTFELVSGATTETASSHDLSVQVGSGSPRPVPGRTPAVVVAVPTGGSATLIMVDKGVRQELTLPDGKPGARNVLINVRHNREATFHRSGGFRIDLRGSGGTGYYSARYTATRAGLFGILSGHRPTSPRNCLFVLNLSYKRTGSIHGPFTSSGTGPFGFRLPLVHVVVNGKTHGAHQVGAYVYYEIPASATSITVLISGHANEGNGITQSIHSRVKFTVSVKAG